jgi:murein DD-endopeptidase MepM/ murein hydrolase activator NlpD
MNILLIPGNGGIGKSSSLPHRYVLLILIVGGLLLPLFLGFITYRIQLLVSRHAGNDDKIAAYSVELSRQARGVEHARQEAETHLNALTRRLGQLQAQVLRLNALGGRLTHMAGLDGNEFNFDVDVAQGGPESDSRSGALQVASALERMSDEIKASEERLRALETLLLDRRLSDAVTPAGWPADGGFVSSGFGKRADPFTGAISSHDGVDIAAKLGSPIKAIADGVVSFAGEKANYGRTIEITHGSGLVTRYAHTLSLLVKVGDKVARGDVIGLVGTSGRSTGPHLHFEVLKDDKAVNPIGYLRASQ